MYVSRANWIRLIERTGINQTMSSNRESSTTKKRSHKNSLIRQQVNIAYGNSIAGDNNTVVRRRRNVAGFQQWATVNGYQLDPRCMPYRNLQSRNGKCVIDGHECVLKTIDGVRMWTLEGIDDQSTSIGDGKQTHALLESPSSLDDSSSWSSSSDETSDTSSSLSENELKRRREYKKRKQAANKQIENN